MKTLYPLFVLLALALAPVPAVAQDGHVDPSVTEQGPGRTAQTLEDILARQRGEAVDDSTRKALIGHPEDAAPMSSPLGTRGGASDPDLWRGLRYDEADVTTLQRGPAATTLIQDNGMWWLEFRHGPLITYGSWLLLGTIGLLAVFYLIRGRVRIDGPKTGRKIERFKFIERMGHWLLAGSFLILGITGLITLMGRKFLIPAFGHDAFSTMAIGAKWIHDNVSWAFMLGLVIIFVMWVVHNIPDRTDIKWFLKGGGLFGGGGHPDAKKFNAGQKIIFWSVILLGASISISGLSLLFPFELHLFGPTFAHLNDWGVPQMLGYGPLPTDLPPQAEMQYSQLWHAIVAFVLMAVILAHIYIGTVGMEGAFDAMGSGMVEEQWAKEHHNLWVAEVKERESAAHKSATPAE
ncbi:formate dehydrogenase subunit gamma [Puniceibacterium sediminis]|uniref:Formate dehydrogenase gamma subunit n=1 Tax=Puniceibacterium sediminis TaxID=1608407 RepID=A0A238XUF3_9RHOB|nr:formate dehydrogenase subunit gamma [Puniceibacterium sediminis]SNR62168.1 formate dehydrogenase gamma subunit [Puniceibacterium sediminis]